MHATWQPGDPVIQLNFPNPLNVSVQVGDVAYFSNPNPVGQVQSWPATTTPHLSNPQSEIKMIGEIIQIIPWNSTFSAIICKMPQALFNQYFAQIVAGGCGDDTNSPPLTNTCDGLTIYETREEILNVAFSAGNYDTFYQFIGVYGTSTLTGNAVFDTQNTCDGMKILHPFYHPTEAINGHTGGLSAAQTLDHWINDHGVTTLNASSTYAEFIAVVSGGQNFGHGWTAGTAGPCRCTYPEICGQGSFIMFSKDNKVNMSDMLGYYASVELRNNSTTEAELFNVGTTFFESSK